jgi:hypothetical protein
MKISIQMNTESCYIEGKKGSSVYMVANGRKQWPFVAPAVILTKLNRMKGYGWV